MKIKNKSQYNKCLKELSILMKEEKRPNNKKIIKLASIIEEYEEDKYKIDMPHIEDAIRFRMEQQGLEQKDLVPYIGSKSKVSEVLAGKIPLSIRMIRNLNKYLGIPLCVLVWGSKDEG